ncbi:hypothetical protein WA026_000067 [Henosepilachna vigintioctopunctata]|uniref:CIP2A N-terminal domain-containing protein n=1 Tax=Henosepilachna vigintioctopunctata TaxID=420089 RepID=A0AAW1V4U6_9CUCU
MSSSNLSDFSFTGLDSRYFRKSIRNVPSTSRNSSLLSTCSGTESKYYKMKKLVISINEYLQNNTEEVASLVSRFLQALSVTIDLSIFDPHTNIASEFYVSLRDLMTKMEGRSSFAWYCVDVLSNACRNSSARLALIHTYQFIPSLARMLGDQISKEKKIRLLKLMQDLTCGIKISWQIPHLPHLMTTLGKWVESSDEEIVALSLGVLVNLCYKNLSAIYTLTSNVDMKRLIRTCLTMKGPILEAHACKLLIICDHINEVGPATNLLKLVNITFSSMKCAFNDRDHILLRQLVEFYIDVKKQNPCGENGDINEIFESEVAELLKTLDRSVAMTASEDGQGDACNLAECVALVFQFLHHLIETDVDCLKTFYPKFVSVSLDWIQNEVVSTQSIAILKAIASRTPPENSALLKPLGVNLPVFLLALDSASPEDTSSFTERNKRTAALLQLLSVMVKMNDLRPKILMELKEETIYKVFYPLLGDDSPRLCASDPSSCSEETVNLYTYAVALVNELAVYDVNWIVIRDNLLQQKQIHYVLCQALYCGSAEVKSMVLQMAGVSTFPGNFVANAMSSMQSLFSLSSPPPARSHHVMMNELSAPVLSVTQVKNLDEVLKQLREAMLNRNFTDISTSDVMELYEYKLASMGHAERAARASAEAASEHCVHLEQRTAQLTAGMNKLHQLLFHTQQRHQEVTKIKQQLEELVQVRTNSFEAEKGRCKAIQSRLNHEERKSAKLQESLEDVNRKLEEAREYKDQLEEQQTKLKQLVSKLEENCSRLEKNLIKKEDSLKKYSTQIEDLTKQIMIAEKELKEKQKHLDNKTLELQHTLEDLEMKSKIIETITKVAQQHKRDD